MDFGDILEQWDRQQTVRANYNHKGKDSTSLVHPKVNKEKRANAQAKAQANAQANAQAKAQMEDWLDRFGTIDKDELSWQRELQSKLERPSFLKALKPQAQVDLHNMTQDEAWRRLDAFVATSCAQGLKKVLIIHGKGNHTQDGEPVLGEMVRHFIECDTRLGESGHPGRAGGGSGATWVIIKG